MTPLEIQNIEDKEVFALGYGSLSEMVANNDYKKIEEMIENLLLSNKTAVSRAADKAYIGMRKQIKKEMVDTTYSDKIFEDDVFAIFKDIFPNSLKWGKEKSGSAVPEGVISLSYNYLDEKDYIVFSYDCKLTEQKEGYELGKARAKKGF